MLGILFWFWIAAFWLMFIGGIDDSIVYDKLIWDPMYSPIIFHAKALYGNYAASIPEETFFHTSWHFVTYGLAPCPVDNYIYCTYGTVMVVFLLGLIGIMMFAILRQVHVLKRRNRIVAALRQ
jgi:hypothetical protein